MSDLWNRICVLIDKNGNVFQSDPEVRGHNAAINNCASKIGLDIPTEQPMPNMLEQVVSNHHIALLNAGKIMDENGNTKRTGYLALPTIFQEEQLENVEILKELIKTEYQAVTVWKLENNHIKRQNSPVVTIIQEMIDEIANCHDSNIRK